jgi:hypothetical protein
MPPVERLTRGDSCKPRHSFSTENDLAAPPQKCGSLAERSWLGPTAATGDTCRSESTTPLMRKRHGVSPAGPGFATATGKHLQFIRRTSCRRKLVSWIHAVRAMCSNRKVGSKRPSGDFCQLMDPDVEERPRSAMTKQIFAQNVSDRLLSEGLRSAL